MNTKVAAALLAGALMALAGCAAQVEEEPEARIDAQARLEFEPSDPATVTPGVDTSGDDVKAGDEKPSPEPWKPASLENATLAEKPAPEPWGPPEGDSSSGGDTNGSPQPEPWHTDNGTGIRTTKSIH